MAKIEIVARINLDVVVRLDGPVSSGAQLKGLFQPGRLGGGGSNTGVALCYAGHEVSLFTDVGNDAAGDAMLAELAGFGADIAQVRRLDEPTPPVMVLLDPAGERTIIRGSPLFSSAPQLPEADEPADALYVKTYGPAVADLLRARLDRCLVVSHAPPAGTRDWPAHVLVNSAAHMTPGELADPLSYASRLAGEALRWMVVTDGARGATAYGSTENVHVPAVLAEVVDSTGAGDVFIAGLIHGLLGGQPIREALRIGARWAASAVGSPSSIPPASLRDLMES
jgi:site-specific DNA-methyltransferase (adenine-specific)